MRISIAMATYNGAKYLQDQLDSFTNQTRLPDELIICDDGSSDETVQILKCFAQTAPFEVVIVSNEKNLGYARNFEKALSLTTGDYIFLSDQDDIWFSNKLEVVLKYFKETSAQVVINDMEISCPGSNVKFSMLSQVNAYKLGDEWYAYGCATSMTREFKEMIMPFPKCFAAHDTWINNNGANINARFILPVALQMYRRHELNVSPLPARRFNLFGGVINIRSRDVESTVKLWSTHINQNKEYLKFIELHGLPSKNTSYCYLTNQTEVYEKRISCVQKNKIMRISVVIKLLFTGKYKFVDGWRSALFDLLV